MELLFISEARLHCNKIGHFYSKDQSSSYQRFKRYLSVYSKVFVVARVQSPGHTRDEHPSCTLVEGDRVSVLPLPYYVGPFQYLVKRKQVRGTLRKYINSYPSAAVICAIPGIIGINTATFLDKKDRPFGLEVIGDPFDAFAPGAMKHPLRPFFRSYFSRHQKSLVKKASATAYVTKDYLQTRYPPGKNQYHTYASNVYLPPKAFVKKVKDAHRQQPFKAISIGSLATMYKGPDVAIEAISILKDRRIRVNLLWIGGGALRSEMITLTKRLGVANRVKFAGFVESTEEVRHHLDESDLFLIPSKTEGMPRALIEAMARGRPCIGTNVGGIPELLDRKAMVPINNAEVLANKIEAFLLNIEFSREQAERNLKVAKKYARDVLKERRVSFYEKLKSLTSL